MFGGLCFLINGNMCCGVQKEDLMVRISKADYPAWVREKGARPMLFTGKEMPGFIYVGPAGHGGKKGLSLWASRCLAFVKTLPAKRAKKKSKPKK